MYKTNTTCYTKLQRCELAPDNFRASKQLFHAFYFHVQQFSVLQFHVLHFHVLHFHPCDFDGPSFSRPALSVAPFTQTALKLFLLLSYFCGPDQSFWLRP